MADIEQMLQSYIGRRDFHGPKGECLNCACDLGGLIHQKRTHCDNCVFEGSAERDELLAEILILRNKDLVAKLHQTVAFLSSVVKSGEKISDWTEIQEVLEAAKQHAEYKPRTELEIAHSLLHDVMESFVRSTQKMGDAAIQSPSLRKEIIKAIGIVDPWNGQQWKNLGK